MTHNFLFLIIYLMNNEPLIELRGFAPIGMLEWWNDGIMDFGELTEWVIGKIKLTNHKRNEKLRINSFGKKRIYIPAKDGIYDIPLFCHSIIPCIGQEFKAPINSNNFNNLYKFRDLQLP